MDLLRGLVGGRVQPDRVRVVGLTIRQRPRPDVLARRGQVVPREVRVELQVGREDAVRDPAPAFDAKRFPVRLRNPLRKTGERLPVRALLRIRRDLRPDRVRDLAQSDGRRNPSLLLSLLHEGDRLVHQLRKRGEPGQVVAVVLRVREPGQPGKDRELRVDPVLLVDRHELRRKPVSFDRRLELAQENVVGKPVVLGEAVPADLLQPRERLLRMRLPPLDRLGRDVRQAVVVPRIAQKGGTLRVLAQLPLPLVVEELRQILRRGVLRRRGTLRRGRGRLRARRLHRAGRQENRRKKEEKNGSRKHRGPLSCPVFRVSCSLTRTITRRRRPPSRSRPEIEARARIGRRTWRRRGRRPRSASCGTCRENGRRRE